ncbi:MAG: hypothetical protein HY752_05600 [Nitrospirae bacterium]|nr:hypothetical protein [Nitrospirota bacterium]
MDYICGKRLAPVLKELIFKLEQHKEIVPTIREQRDKGKASEDKSCNNRQALSKGKEEAANKRQIKYKTWDTAMV